MKKVILKIEGKQTNCEGEENVIELMTEGKLYKKQNALYLVYEETELSGMEGSTTTVKLTEDKILMKRFGTSNSSILFEKGKKHAANYMTPYGNFDMEVITKDLNYRITDTHKGEIYIAYHVNMQGMTESSNQLSIHIM